MFQSKEIVHMLRSKHPNGTRVQMVSSTDPHPVESGTTGSVTYVDDAGTVHVNWDNGRRLGLVYDEDNWDIIDIEAV